jgi:hypothetical protein
MLLILMYRQASFSDTRITYPPKSRTAVPTTSGTNLSALIVPSLHG